MGNGGFWFIRKFFKAILKVLGFLCGVMYGCEFQSDVNVMEGDLLKNE